MRKRKLKKIIGGIFLALFVLFVGITGYKLAYTLLCPSKLPSFFGYTDALVLSGSMEPILSTGDMVICKRQKEYQIDDIIVYYDKEDGSFVMHRIVGDTKEGFITKGDFNPDDDPKPVGVENIQGKVVRSIPNMKTYRDIAVGVLLTLLIQMVVKLSIDIYKERREKEHGQE